MRAKLLTLFGIVATIAILPGPARAGGLVAASAEISRPPSQATRLVAEDTIWTCEGGVCRGQVNARERTRLRTCAAVARRYGPVTAFRAGEEAFDEAALARCNRLGGAG